LVLIKRRRMARIAASEVMQPPINIERNFSKLRRPPGGLVGARHKPAVMVDRFEQGDLEGIAGIENAERARTEAARPISAYMGERRHEVAGAGTNYAPIRRDEIEGANGLHQPRIGLPLSGDKKRPVGRVRAILEQVDRRMDAADDSDRV